MALVSLLHAQIDVRASLPMKEYIAFEDVRVSIAITNNSGQTIQFENAPGAPWMEFVVRNTSGDTFKASDSIVFTPIKIGVGETKTTSFVLNKQFSMGQPGNYSVFAIVRMPGQPASAGRRSGNIYFDIYNGNAVWRKTVGVVGSNKEKREYRVITKSGAERTDLYVQVEDKYRGRVLATYSMGRYVTFRKFTATLDKNHHLHVFFLTTPEIYCHTVVNSDGKTTQRRYHKHIEGRGSPRLARTDNGSVGVLNSLPYDPVKERKQRLKIHPLSEMPYGVIQ